MQRTSIIFHHPVGNADLKANQIHIQMKIAYLYVRVTMDEQKRKGYSLTVQEDRLLKYCRYNNIEVKGGIVKISPPRISTDLNGKNYF